MCTEYELNTKLNHCSTIKQGVCLLLISHYSSATADVQHTENMCKWSE